MNMNEYGNIFIRINVNENISTFTNTLILISPEPKVLKTVITDDDGLTVPAIPLDTGTEIYAANEYAEYEFEIGDVFISGIWNARLESINPANGSKRITDLPLNFTIEP